MWWMIHALTLTPEAAACTMLYRYEGVLQLNLEEVQPPGFAVRFPPGDPPQDARLIPNDAGDLGEQIQLTEVDAYTWQVPTSLESGTYMASWSRENLDIQVGEIDPGEAEGLAELVALDLWSEVVAEGITASCRPSNRHSHLMVGLDLELPAAAHSGWAVSLRDEERGNVGWVALEDEARAESVVFDLGRRSDRADEETCIALDLWSPEGERIHEGEAVCARNPSCATGPTSRGLTGLMVALLALGWRRPR